MTVGMDYAWEILTNVWVYTVEPLTKGVCVMIMDIKPSIGA